MFYLELFLVLSFESLKKYPSDSISSLRPLREISSFIKIYGRFQFVMSSLDGELVG